jgi:hypothetical protein
MLCEGLGRKRPSCQLLGGIKENGETIRQNCRYPSRNWNQDHPRCKSTLVPLTTYSLTKFLYVLSGYTETNSLDSGPQETNKVAR